MNEYDIIGKTFGRLKVIDFSHKKQIYKNGKKDGNRLYYLCQCICGNNIIVSKDGLKTGKTKSCGCFRKETSAKNGKNGAKKVGDKLRKYTKQEKALVSILLGMINRCNNKKCKAYKNYGGRGIKICDEWLEKFNGKKKFIDWAVKNGYKKGLTIDRIDVNGNYCPENCRWATYKEQCRNKRCNKLLEINNQKKCVTEWAEIYGINEATIRRRASVGDVGERLVRKTDLLKRRFIK